MRNVKVLAITLLGLILITSCKKDNVIETEGSVEETSANPVVTFNFEAQVNNLLLIPETKWYTNTSKDSFNVTKFNYYISNIKLTREDGTIFKETESYHLVKHVEGITSFTLSDVPVGNYTNIEFLIGVDSLRNVSGAQTGALSVSNDMFWEWKSGYIFFKLEGSYSTSSQKIKSQYGMHIGGFKGKFPCLQTCSLPLITGIEAKKNKHSTVFFNVNIDEIFIHPQEIGFDYYFNNISDAMFQQISINYKDMFTVKKIEN